MTELLENIMLANETLFQIHHIPFLKKMNEDIKKELEREK